MLRQLVFKAFVLACGAASVSADLLVLEPVKDATLFNSPTGNAANGKNWAFFVGLAGANANEPIRRGLVAFDVSAIPAGSTVSNVQLVLYMSQTTSGSKTIEMRRVTSAWNEGVTAGASGMPGNAQNGDVTWLHTNYPSSFWNAPGGDFAGAASASLSVNQVAYYTWGSNAALVADVQGWVNAPSTNHGWILTGPETGAKSAKRFEARESGAQYRPKLHVTYSLPPPSSYCTAKTNSQGCVPAMSSIGTPDANAGSGFAVRLTNTLNQKQGVFFYGTVNATALPFQGGFLCVQPPTRRTPVQSSGGNPTPPQDCSGLFSYDFNVLIASGADPTLVAGAGVWSQYWSRDPADPFTTNFSDGLRFYIYP